MNGICDKLHKLSSNLRKFRFPLDAENIPNNGIYVLFEKGESAHETDRIVRVGTHRGNDNLLSRLNEHFVNPNKNRSIFRKNIGRVVLNENKDPFLKEWDMKLTVAQIETRFPDGSYARRTSEIENIVTQRIQSNFNFVVFEIKDQARRLELEKKIISTVSLCKDCSPSKNWFGLHSPKKKIETSGLWLVQGLYKKSFLLSESDYKELEGNGIY